MQRSATDQKDGPQTCRKQDAWRTFFKVMIGKILYLALFVSFSASWKHVLWLKFAVSNVLMVRSGKSAVVRTQNYTPDVSRPYKIKWILSYHQKLVNIDGQKVGVVWTWLVERQQVCSIKPNPCWFINGIRILPQGLNNKLGFVILDLLGP